MKANARVCDVNGVENTETGVDEVKLSGTVRQDMGMGVVVAGAASCN